MNLPKVIPEFTKAKVSKAGFVNKQDLAKWTWNMIRFLRPLALLYLGAAIAIQMVPNHVFALQDLVPSQFVIGGMVLYLLNSAYDFFSKLNDGKK